MKISALASVYISTDPDYLYSSIKSLELNSSLPDQVVIVLDGPISVRVKSVLDLEWSFPSMKLVPLERNLGLGAALQLGMKACFGDVVMRFDTDDYNSPFRVSVVRSFFESHPSVDILGTYVIEFATAPKEVSCIHGVLKTVPCSHRSICRALDYKNSINHPSVSFRRSSIEAIGGYLDCEFFEDYHLWLRARRSLLKFHNLPVASVFMRRENVIERRNGFSYLRAELNFFLASFRAGLIPLSSSIWFFARFFLRVLPLPPKVVATITFWRSRVSRKVLNPDFLCNQ